MGLPTWLLVGLGWIPRAMEHKCMYGSAWGDRGPCDVVVAPFDGWRSAGLVFCTEEHASLDMLERVF